MTNIATYLEEMVLDWNFAGTGFDTAPGTFYIGLHTADPGEDGSSGEVSASDYGRASADDTDMTKSATGGPTTYENSGDIGFGVAENDWGDVSHVSIWDDTSANGGNCLWQGALDSTRTVNTNDEFILRAGDLTVDLD